MHTLYIGHCAIVIYGEGVFHYMYDYNITTDRSQTIPDSSSLQQQEPLPPHLSYVGSRCNSMPRPRRVASQGQAASGVGRVPSCSDLDSRQIGAGVQREGVAEMHRSRYQIVLA